jgi:hypothetical protein
MRKYLLTTSSRSSASNRNLLLTVGTLPQYVLPDQFLTAASIRAPSVQRQYDESWRCGIGET